MAITFTQDLFRVDDLLHGAGGHHLHVALEEQDAFGEYFDVDHLWMAILLNNWEGGANP